MTSQRIRTLVVVSLVVLAAAFALAACGDDSNNSGSQTTTTPADDAGGPAPEFVGLSKDDAIAKAEDEDLTWRILREDDEEFPATMDFRTDRVNFAIDDGKVTEANFG